jgi:hypothetical protein
MALHPLAPLRDGALWARSGRERLPRLEQLPTRPSARRIRASADCPSASASSPPRRATCAAPNAPAGCGLHPAHRQPEAGPLHPGDRRAGTGPLGAHLLLPRRALHQSRVPGHGALRERSRLYTSTSTNAHFLDEAKAEATVRSGLSRLIISLDGTDQETYSAYRKEGDAEQGDRRRRAHREVEEEAEEPARRMWCSNSWW